MFPSKLPREGPGAHAPAFLFCSGLRLFLSSVAITAMGAAAWFTSIAIGEHLAGIRLQRVTAGLPQIEMLTRQIAATLHQQGVCLDAPPQQVLAHAVMPSRIEQLQAQLAVQGACVDLAIAQQQLETLRIQTATIQLIHRKKIWTAGFVTDSLAYRAHSGRDRPLPKTVR